MDIESTVDYHLEKNTDQDSALNFEFLRARGIELVQKYAGTTWTDYNLHDPGVTILEYLCYAITDLAYRTSFPIADILTGKDGTIDLKKNLFFLKNEILTTNPVLVNDFKKLVIDKVPEVYNVWIEPVGSVGSRDYIKGLYNVFIQPTNDYIQEHFEEHDANEHEPGENDIAAKVKAVLAGARNIGYDYESFSVLDPCDIQIEADIVVDPHTMHEELLAQVYDVLIKTLNPPINFYTEATLRERGMSTEEIYQGPALAHGFIVDEEMTEKVSIIDPSDLTKAVLGIEGVQYVRKLVVSIDGEPYEHRPHYLQANRFPRFTFNLEEPTIRLFSDNYEITVKKTIFSSLLHKKLDSNKRKYIRGYNDNFNDSTKGEYRNISLYQSIQHLFPPAYRINIDEIENVRAARAEQNIVVRNNQGKAKQLKAYLMLFEQVLANYLAQLGSIGDILSPSLTAGVTLHSYFAQPLYDVPAAGNILADFMKPGTNPTHADWELFKEDPNNAYMQFLETAVETDEVFTERKKRLLDHMLLRFNINLLKYPLQVYEKLYKPREAGKRDLELHWKADILNQVDTLTSNRNQAFDHTASYFDTTGGFEKLMCLLLYMKDGSRKRIGEAFDRSIQNGKLSVEKNEARQSPGDKLISYEVNWDAQRLDMLIAQEEADRLLDPNLEETIQDSVAIHIPGRKISFLKEGIEHVNYKIGPEINGKGFIILFRTPSERQWMRVGKYATRDRAVAALNGFMETLRAISIETEGFHLVEHILLRPSLQSASFGFQFHDDKGEIVLKQKLWFSFDERKDAIEEILLAAASDEEDAATKLIEVLERSCLVNTSKDRSVPVFSSPQIAFSAADGDHYIKRLTHWLRQAQELGIKMYPCFSNMVRREDGSEIAEDFFRFRMTVVFPGWPARFQDKTFRQYAENLFIENSPAHMKLHFKWLSIGGIKKFEETYFSWIDSMRQNEGAIATGTDQLISFLRNDPV